MGKHTKLEHRMGRSPSCSQCSRYMKPFSVVGFASLNLTKWFMALTLRPSTIPTLKSRISLGFLIARHTNRQLSLSRVLGKDKRSAGSFLARKKIENLLA